MFSVSAASYIVCSGIRSVVTVCGRLGGLPLHVDDCSIVVDGSSVLQVEDCSVEVDGSWVLVVAYCSVVVHGSVDCAATSHGSTAADGESPLACSVTLALDDVTTPPTVVSARVVSMRTDASLLPYSRPTPVVSVFLAGDNVVSAEDKFGIFSVWSLKVSDALASSVGVGCSVLVEASLLDVVAPGTGLGDVLALAKFNSATMDVFSWKCVDVVNVSSGGVVTSDAFEEDSPTGTPAEHDIIIIVVV